MLIIDLVLLPKGRTLILMNIQDYELYISHEEVNDFGRFCSVSKITTIEIEISLKYGAGRTVPYSIPMEDFKGFMYDIYNVEFHPRVFVSDSFFKLLQKMTMLESDTSQFH